MQFYLEGFQAGDPTVAPRRDGADPHPAEMPAEVDVLIVGCGPAGLVLAAQLSAFPDIVTRIVERKSGPLALGQADGVACRTVEMFDAFGLSAKLLQEGYWVNETVFWSPDAADPSRIVRSGRVQDVEDGLSEFPHLIVNQARIHAHLLDVARRSPRRLEPDYGVELVDLVVHEESERPVEARLARVSAAGEPETFTVRAKYVVGCDGARSTVRRTIGRVLEGDSANQAWGVMDVLAVTDFPDIRFKALIQSADQGNIVLIPREGGYLVRFYIEMDKLAEGERVAGRSIEIDDLLAATNRILHPYTLDVRDVVWWSVYEIGQRLTDRFDDVPDAQAETRLPRVFIAGDACHTHSPKAGQGMNVSMQDAFNLGWKLAAVLEGRSGPELLRTYTQERQPIAKQLIDFDREWARTVSMQPKDPHDPHSEGIEPEQLRKAFVQSGRYTAGVATRYAPSLLTASADHQRLATGFPVGERFHSAPVLRIADAKPMQLGHVAQADGRWRLYAFADDRDVRETDSRLASLCRYLAEDPASPVRRFTPAGADLDAVFDVRAVLQQEHGVVSVPDLPAILRPTKGRLGLVDYEKVFTARTGGTDIYAERGVDRREGALVIVRPDQYVAGVLPLDAFGELAAYFGGFMRETKSR